MIPYNQQVHARKLHQQQGKMKQCKNKMCTRMANGRLPTCINLYSQQLEETIFYCDSCSSNKQKENSDTSDMIC